MKKILVTGGSGFIGGQVVEELLSRGYEVHVLSISPIPEQRQNLVCHIIDLFDQKSVQTFLEQNSFEQMIHLAWYVGPKCHTSNVNIDWVSASLQLLQEFKRFGGKKILIAGSVSEYDFRYGYMDEFLTPLGSQSLYGQSKACLYRMGSIFAKQNEIDFKWARIFNLYGPNERRARLMPSVICSMIKNESVLVSDCKKFQDYLHVFDTANAIVSFFESSIQGPVNISSGHPVLLRDIVEQLATLTNFTGEIKWGAIPSSFEEQLVVGNNSRLTNEVKWAQKINLVEGLKQTIEWWNKNDVQ